MYNRASFGENTNLVGFCFYVHSFDGCFFDAIFVAKGESYCDVIDILMFL